MTRLRSCVVTQADAEAPLKRKHNVPEHHAKKARLSTHEACAALSLAQTIDLDLLTSDSECDARGSLSAPQRKRPRFPEAYGSTGAAPGAGPQHTAAARAPQRPGAAEPLPSSGAAGGASTGLAGPLQGPSQGDPATYTARPAAPQAAGAPVPEGSDPATAATGGSTAGALVVGGAQAGGQAAGGPAACPPARAALAAVPPTAAGRAALAAAMEVEAAGLRQALAAQPPLAPLAQTPRDALNRAEV